jgi:hypothetical protein
MRIRVTSVDYAPPELNEQRPFEAQLLKKLPGKDRDDYWVAVLVKPLKWVSAGGEREVKHIIVTARWQGTQIGQGMKGLPMGIAFVTDDSVLSDSILDFRKCVYVAIGVADEC